MPEFVEVGSPTDDEVRTLLQAIITRPMKMLTRRHVLVEDMGQTWRAEPDDNGEESRTLQPLQAAARIGPHSGVKLLAEVFPTRLTRGAGLPAVERIAYLAEMAGMQRADIEQRVLVDAKAPVSFFAYPGKPS